MEHGELMTLTHPIMSTCVRSPYRYDWSLPWTGQQRNSLTIWKLHQHGKRTRRRTEKESQRYYFRTLFLMQGEEAEVWTSLKWLMQLKKEVSTQRSESASLLRMNTTYHKVRFVISIGKISTYNSEKKGFLTWSALCTRVFVPESVWRRGPGDNRGGRGLSWVHDVESLVKWEWTWAHYGWCRGGTCCSSWRNIL